MAISANSNGQLAGTVEGSTHESLRFVHNGVPVSLTRESVSQQVLPVLDNLLSAPSTGTRMPSLPQFKHLGQPVELNLGAREARTGPLMPRFTHQGEQVSLDLGFQAPPTRKEHMHLPEKEPRVSAAAMPDSTTMLGAAGLQGLKSLLARGASSLNSTLSDRGLHQSGTEALDATRVAPRSFSPTAR